MKKIILLLAAAILLAACATTPKQCKHAEWTKGSTVYELNVRQFTPEGTFAAAATYLPIIKKMGIDILWVMPVYPIGELNRKGTLGSYYAVKDYCAINPEFGTMEDFDMFLEYAHEQGFKVILDWVANHTSPDHAWVTEKPADWYVRDAEGNIVTEYDWTDIAKLNYDNKDMRAEMEKCMAFWVDKGVDGFRCDVAHQVPEDFWKHAISQLKAKNPELYFLAEGEGAWLHRAGFDATYWWTLHHVMNDIAQGKAGKAELLDVVNKSMKENPSNAYRLAFITNHDENSWNGTEFERLGEGWRAFMVLSCTLPGAQPLIYTGQELGNRKRFEFFEKDPLPAEHWNNVENIQKIYGFYFSLLSFYHSHPCIQPWSNAKFEVVENDPRCVDETWLSFNRILPDDAINVLVHLAAPYETKLSLSAVTQEDIASEAQVAKPAPADSTAAADSTVAEPAAAAAE